jgi:hypothetical protein
MLSWGSLHKTNNTNIKPITASLAVLCRYVRATHQNLYLFLYYLQLPMQSKHNTPKVVSSNPVHDEVYSIQHYVIKFVSALRQVGGTPVSSTNKTDRQI